MLNWQDIGKYRENNRIEAKRATGGFPHSVWETYSAFANTVGGVILLGVEERPDHSLHVAGLPDAAATVEEFWTVVNDPRRVSDNFLAGENVQIIRTQGQSIVAIEVPPAARPDRPVYLGEDPLTGTYRRSGEGDYRCSAQEVRRMLREREDSAQDARPVEEADLSALVRESVEDYRARFRLRTPRHRLHALADAAFLREAGAAAGDGAARPTAAGLWLFGTAASIRRSFPGYALEYRARDRQGRVCERLSAARGDWSGNLLDFYFSLCPRLQRQVATMAAQAEDGRPAAPEKLEALQEAAAEALANAVIHADYTAPGGLRVDCGPEGITIANPGILRAGRAAAAQGIADTRNGTLSRLFARIGVGSGAGGGLQRMRSSWERYAAGRLALREQFGPDRVELRLGFAPEGPPDAAARRAMQAALLDYLTEHVEADAPTLARHLGRPVEEVLSLLSSLWTGGLIADRSQGDTVTYLLRR